MNKFIYWNKYKLLSKLCSSKGGITYIQSAPPPPNQNFITGCRAFSFLDISFSAWGYHYK